MAKNWATEQDVKRIDMFMIHPDDLVDSDGHGMHRLEAPIDDLVASMVETGRVFQPIRITKSADGVPHVTAGSRRRRAASEATKIRAKSGLPPVLVPCWDIDLKDVKNNAEGIRGRLREIMVGENACRLRPDPMWWASMAKMAVEEDGRSIEEVGALCGVTGKTIRGWMRLLTAHPKVQDAVRAGKIGMSAAVSLSALPPAEQPAMLNAALEEHATGREITDSVKAARGTHQKPEVRKHVKHHAVGRRLARKIVVEWTTARENDGAVKKDAELAAAVLALKWAAGDVSEKDVVAQIPALNGLVERAKRDGRRAAQADIEEKANGKMPKRARPAKASELSVAG